MQDTGFHVGEFVWVHYDRNRFPTKYQLAILETILPESKVRIRYVLSGHSANYYVNDLVHINPKEYKYVNYIPFADFQIAVCEDRAEGVILEKSRVIALDYGNETEADIVSKHDWFARVDERHFVKNYVLPRSGLATFENPDPTTYRAKKTDAVREFENQFETTLPRAPPPPPRPPRRNYYNPDIPFSVRQRI